MQFGMNITILLVFAMMRLKKPKKPTKNIKKLWIRLEKTAANYNINKVLARQWGFPTTHDKYNPFYHISQNIYNSDTEVYLLQILFSGSQQNGCNSVNSSLIISTFPDHISHHSRDDYEQQRQPRDDENLCHLPFFAALITSMNVKGQIDRAVSR